jgi:hypothetical protein
VETDIAKIKGTFFATVLCERAKTPCSCQVSSLGRSTCNKSPHFHLENKRALSIQVHVIHKPEGRRPLGRPRRRWEDNIKMNLRRIGWDSMDWLELAQDRDQWRALVNTAKNLRSL